MDLHNFLHIIDFKAKKTQLSKNELEKASKAMKKLEEIQFKLAE